jgi:hypothetical protein
MQIALEKEYQAKELLIDENNQLKQELDVRQQRINDLQSKIDTLNMEIRMCQTEANDLRTTNVAYKKTLESTGIPDHELQSIVSRIQQHINQLPNSTFSALHFANDSNLLTAASCLPTHDSHSDIYKTSSITGPSNASTAIIRASSSVGQSGHPNNAQQLPIRHLSTVSNGSSTIANGMLPVASSTTGGSGTPSQNPLYIIDDSIKPDDSLDSSNPTSASGLLTPISGTQINNNMSGSQIMDAGMPSSGVNKNLLNIKQQQILQQPNNSTSSISSTASSTAPLAGVTPNKEHRFDVLSFQTVERCEYCNGILYGICRQGVKCRDKGCGYLCHSKCRQNLPLNCPININQKLQLKNVEFIRSYGASMQGNLKVPKIGGVKKGWQDHFVFLSNARLFVFPIIDNRPSLVPAQIIDIRDPQFSISAVNESDVIHASKRDLPCIFKVTYIYVHIN